MLEKIIKLDLLFIQINIRLIKEEKMKKWDILNENILVNNFITLPNKTSKTETKNEDGQTLNIDVLKLLYIQTERRLKQYA